MDEKAFLCDNQVKEQQSEENESNLFSQNPQSWQKLKKKRKMYLLFWLYCMSKWFELPISLNEEKWRKMGVPCECARICWRGRTEEQRHYIITH